MSKKNRKNAAQTNDTTPTAVIETVTETPIVETVSQVETATVIETPTEIATVVPTANGPKIKVRKKGPPASRVFDKAILAAAVAAANGDVDAARLNLFDKGELTITANVDSVKLYVSGYRDQTPHEGSGGYSSFATKNDAFTNQDMLNTFTPQGILRMMALLIAQSAKVMTDGGDKAAILTQGLKGLAAYQAVAIDEARKANVAAAEMEALAIIMKANGGDEGAARAKLAMFASQAPKPPAPAATVEADEPTLDESGNGIGDNADELAETVA